MGSIGRLKSCLLFRGVGANRISVASQGCFRLGEKMDMPPLPPTNLARSNRQCSTWPSRLTTVAHARFRSEVKSIAPLAHLVSALLQGVFSQTHLHGVCHARFMCQPAIRSPRWSICKYGVHVFDFGAPRSARRGVAWYSPHVRAFCLSSPLLVVKWNTSGQLCIISKNG